MLDVSNKGISDLTGIANFTNLEELYAQDNTLNTSVDLKNNKKLRILNISGNSAITGFSANYTPYVDINFGNGSNTTNLKELYCANCAIFYAGGLQYNTGLKVLSMPHNVLDYFSSTTMSALSNLEYLDMSYNKLTSSQSLSNNTKLIYVDVSENPTFNSYFSHLEKLTQLKTFKAANCKLTADQTKYSSTNGYFPNESVEYVDVSNNPALNTMYCPANNNLKTIIANGCTGLGGSSSSCALSPTSGGTYLPRMTHLEHLELSNVDLYLNTGNSTYGLFSLISPSVAPNLHYIDLSNDQLGSLAKPVFGFPKLETLLLNNNPSLTLVTVKDLTTPKNLQINVTSDNALATIAINNSGLDGTNIPTIIGWDYANAILNYNSNNFSNIPTVPSNVSYLYLQDNNLGGGDYTLLTTSLVGLDLGNNGFTKFKMTGNGTLKSLALAGNTALTEIELHGNTQLTQTSPNGVIENDNGLYIKGLSSLLTLNIENSSFEKLGQGRSLEGLTGLTKLQARKNKFTTFTNGVYALDVAGSGNYRIADPTESTLEDLPALEYLDLAYNNLQDSVHLYKNVNLKHLDVSHNRTIHGVYDGAITPDDTKAQKAMRAKKAFNLMKYGKVYNGVGVNPTVGADWVDGLPPEQAATARPFDIRYEDLNDTIGLYHLNLCMNTKLEYLDISYTNIHNTASGPTFMNPGWMDKDWVEDMGVWDAVSSPNTPENRAYMRWHTFVYIIPCYKLKEFHTDHNNMRSLGVRYFPELEILTSNNMYGDGDFMRDYGNYGNGNIGLSGEVQKLDKVKWSTNDDGDVTATLSFVGPNGSGSYYPNPTKYLDLSNSGFNEIRVNNGVNLEYLDVSGNPLNFAVHDQNKSYYNSLDVTYCPNIVTVKADNCSDLPIVRAYNRPELVQLNVDNDPKLKALYIQKDPKLSLVSADAEDERACFTGLSTLEGLETLFAYTNPQFGGIDVTKNTALKNLWISNIGAGSIDLSNNTALTKLRIYDNSLSELDVASNTALTWLDLARNQVPSLDLSSNESLQYFNCSNSVESLTDPSLADGSHDGSEADEKVPVSGTAKADNGGNSLSDLEFASAAPLTDVRANYNDLHKITGGFAGLTNIEYAHNHINGINLSAANLSNLTVNSEDNGRTITADCATFRKKVNGTVQEYKVYFFQLQKVEGNGAQLTTKTSTDGKGTTRVLGTDGLALDNITAWTSDAAVLAASTTGAHLNSTITPDDMSALDPGDVPGQIVVLKPTNEDAQGATGKAQYSYNDGFESGHTSTYYLKWSSNGTVTGISQIDPDQDFNIENTSGSLIVTGSDGTTVGVYDMNGRLVANEVITGGKATITGLTPGIYIVNGNKVLIK